MGLVSWLVIDLGRLLLTRHQAIPWPTGWRGPALVLPEAPAARPPALPLLQVIQASAGTQIHLVPVDDVLYFEAADKYVRVLTAQCEYLIPTPLKELMAQLDPAVFWQVHRGTLVRATAVSAALRGAAERLQLQLRGRQEQLAVSRLYAHRFKAT